MDERLSGERGVGSAQDPICGAPRVVSAAAHPTPQSSSLQPHRDSWDPGYSGQFSKSWQLIDSVRSQSGES